MRYIYIYISFSSVPFAVLKSSFGNHDVVLMSLSTRATPSLSPSHHGEACLWAGSKPSAKLYLEVFLTTNAKMALATLLRVEIYIWQHRKGLPTCPLLRANCRWNLHSLPLHHLKQSYTCRRGEGVTEPSGIKGLVASCQEGDGKVEKDDSVLESSRKFETAIKRSRDLLQRAKVSLFYEILLMNIIDDDICDLHVLAHNRL